MQFQFKNILWPTDLSPQSFKAIPYIHALFNSFNSTLHVIHVVSPVVFTSDHTVPMMTAGDMLATPIDVIGPATKSLDALVTQQFPGTSPTAHVLIGTPWHDICQYAQQHSIDLIVLATHGSTGLAHLLMGSVAERVVQHSPCPVLTVKSFERPYQQK